MLTSQSPFKFICLILICIAIIASMNTTIVKVAFQIPVLDYNLKRLIEFGLLGLVGIGAIISPSIRKNIMQMFGDLPKWIQILFCVFFILGIISATLAIDPKYGFLEIGNYGLLLILGLFLGRELTDKKSRRTLFTAFFLMLILYFAYQLFIYYRLHHIIALGKTVPIKIIRMWVVYPQFINQRFFAQVYIWVWPLFIFFSMLAWKRHKILGVIMLVISAYFINLGLANNSRAVYYSMILAVVIMSILFRKESLQWWKFFIPAFVLSLILNYLTFNVGLNFGILFSNNARVDLTNNGRFHLWSLAYHQFITHYPFFGAGPLNFATVPNPGFNAHPHNFFVKTAAEWGIPAALIIITLSITGFWAWTKSAWLKTTENLNLRMALTIILFGSAFDAMISGNLLMPFAQLLAPIFIGLALSVFYSKPQETTTAIWKHGICVIFIALCLYFVIQGILPNIFQFQETFQDAFQMMKNCSHACLVPTLIWFPEQISPLMMWVR